MAGRLTNFLDKWKHITTLIIVSTTGDLKHLCKALPTLICHLYEIPWDAGYRREYVHTSSKRYKILPQFWLGLYSRLSLETSHKFVHFKQVSSVGSTFQNVRYIFPYADTSFLQGQHSVCLEQNVYALWLTPFGIAIAMGFIR